MKKIKNLVVEEGSLVREPANQHARVCLFKSADAETDAEARGLLRRLAAFFAKSETPAVTESAVVEEPTKPENDMDEQMKMAAAAIEAKHAEALAQATAEAEAAKAALAETQSKLDAIEKMQIAKSLDDRASKLAVPGMSPEDVRQLVDELHKANLLDRVEKALTASCRIEKAAEKIEKEVGTDATGADDDPRAKLDNITKSIRDERPALTKEQAYSEALRRNPELYKEVLR